MARLKEFQKKVVAWICLVAMLCTNVFGNIAYAGGETYNEPQRFVIRECSHDCFEDSQCLAYMPEDETATASDASSSNASSSEADNRFGNNCRHEHDDKCGWYAWRTKFISKADDGATVKAVVESSYAESLPAGAELVATRLDDEESEITELIQEQSIVDPEESPEFLAYDIHFESDGVEIEPEAAVVTVQIYFEEALALSEEAQSVRVLHVTEANQIEDLVGEVTADVNGDAKSVEFKTESFSTFIVLSKTAKTGRIFDLNQMGWISDNSSLSINGEIITAGSTVNVKYGDEVELEVLWVISNDVILTAEDTMVYKLPAGLNFPDGVTGKLTDGRGTYTIANNQFSFQLSKSFLDQEGLSNIVGGIAIHGKITEVTTGNENGGEVTFEFPGIGQFIFNVAENKGLSIKKESVKKIDAFTQEYKITVKATGDNTNVVVTDTMGEFLSITDLSSISVQDSAGNVIADAVAELTEKGFQVTIPVLADGETCTIAYQANVLKGAFISNDKNGLKNTATVVSNEVTVPQSSDVTISRTKASVEKSGGNIYGTNQIKWEIKISPGDLLPQNTIIKDTLGPGLTYLEGSFVLQERHEGESWKESSDFTWEDISRGNGYILPGDSNKYYQIRYTTIASDQNSLNSNKYKNTVTIIPGGTGGSTSQSPEITIPGSGVIKKAGTADEASQTISWMTTLTLRAGVSNARFKDEFQTSGLTLLPDTIKVNGEKLSEGMLSLITTGKGGFEINFGDIYQNSGASFANPLKLEITYDTAYATPDSKVTHKNKATFLTNQGSINNTASVIVGKEKPVYLDSKQFLPEKSQDRFTTGVVTWQINIKEIPDSFSNVKIVDILPKGMEYVPGTAELYKFKNNTKLGNLADPQIADGTITFDVSEIEQLHNGGFSIQYQSKIINSDAMFENTNYINTAQLYLDDEKNEERKANCQIQVNKPITKQQAYDKYTAPTVNYTIEVNKGKLDLDPQKEEITLKDAMGTGLDFVPGTLKVDGQHYSNYTYNSETRVLEITVADKKHMTITYSANVNMEIGLTFDEFNGFNKVTLEGSAVFNTGDETQLVGKVVQAAAWVTGDTNGIKIFKYQDGKMNLPLNGAEFTVTAMNYDASANEFYEKTGIEDNYFKKAVTTASMDIMGDGSVQDGYAEVKGLKADVIYRLVETGIPSGYELDAAQEATYYFGFDGTDKGISSLPDVAGVKALVSGTIIYRNNITQEIEPTAVEIPLAARKTVVNNSGKPHSFSAGEFSFLLKSGTGDIIAAASNDAGGTIDFGTIRYTVAGTYHYVMSEVKGTDTTHFSYDQTTYDIAVEIKDKGDGLLYVDSVKMKKQGTVTYETVFQFVTHVFDGKTQITFKNIYIYEEPTEPTDPTEPSQPTDPTEPSKPTDPTEPSKPTDPTEPSQPTEPTEPSQPTDPTEPSQPTAPTEPSQPTEPTNPTKPSRPSRPSASQGGPGTVTPESQTVVIQDGDIPLAGLPIVLDEEEVPLAGLPKTGDDRQPYSLVVTILLGALLGSSVLLKRKKEMEE